MSERRVRFNYDDYRLSDIDYRASQFCKRKGLLSELDSLPVYFFGAKQSRDEVADIFISSGLFHKVCRTLLFLKRQNIKTEVGLGDIKDSGRGYWIAFSNKMRRERLADCVRVILCILYETNNLLKEESEVS